MKITEEMIYEFDERAAIMEVDGKASREVAERKALGYMSTMYKQEFELGDFRPNQQQGLSGIDE